MPLHQAHTQQRATDRGSYGRHCVSSNLSMLPRASSHPVISVEQSFSGGPAANRPANPGEFYSWILICFMVSWHFIYVCSMLYNRIFVSHPLVRSVFAEMLICNFPLLASIVPPPGIDAACPGPPVGRATITAPQIRPNVYLACARGPKRVGPTGNRGPP